MPSKALLTGNTMRAYPPAEPGESRPSPAHRAVPHRAVLYQGQLSSNLTCRTTPFGAGPDKMRWPVLPHFHFILFFVPLSGLIPALRYVEQLTPEGSSHA